MTNRPKDLTDQLVAAGIPILGVSIDQLGEGSDITVQFDPSATQQQQAQAATIVATFRASRAKRKRPLLAIMADIGNLSAADRAKLNALVAADWLQQNPKAARAVSIALDGDEDAT